LVTMRISWSKILQTLACTLSEGNTKGGCITVLLTSCLTGLELVV
jgi:hypothetical protein